MCAFVCFCVCVCECVCVCGGGVGVGVFFTYILYKFQSDAGIIKNLKNNNQQ